MRCRSPFQHGLTILLLVQAVSVAAAQQLPSDIPFPIGAPPSALERMKRSRPSVTLDLSKGASFTFTIAPDSPPVTFRIIPEPREADPYGNARSTVRDIEVFRGDSNQPFQHLSGCDFASMEPPPRAETDPPWFHAEDVNFDGFEDIFILTTWGATGNQSGCMWLFNPASQRFEYSKEFSDLPRHWLDTTRKTIVTFGGGGMAGMVHQGERYKIENGHLALIYSESQDWDQDKKQFHCTVQERQGRSMVTIADDSGTEGAKACDGSKLSNSQSTAKFKPNGEK